MNYQSRAKAWFVVGGLTVLLMIVALACVDAEPKASENPKAVLPSPTHTVAPVLTPTPGTPLPSNTLIPTTVATQAMNTPTPASIPTAHGSSYLRDFKNGPWLEQEAPELASSINKLAWLQDGIDDTEYEAIQDLLYLAVESREVASAVVSLGWVQDGINDLEASAVSWMNNIADGRVASSVVALSWVQDGIDDVEVKTIEHLSYITNKDAGVGVSIVALGWVQDGVNEIEAKGIDWLSNMRSTEVTSSVVLLAWVKNGIEAAEVKAIEHLSYIANEGTEVGVSVVSLDWVRDNIDGTEYTLLEDIASIADKDMEAALRIVVMPFVETVEPSDVSAMASLRQLAAFKPESFASVMSHPTMRDGITNDLAPVVATLNGVAETNPDLIGVLLAPNSVLLEQRTITLPLSGDVDLLIIRTRPGAARSMDLLEHSVRSAEEYMEEPLPTNFIGLLYEDAVAGSSAGTNFGTHIAIRPTYDIDDGSHEAEFAGSNIAHEVAHYYWSGNADWVDEGAADVLASIIEGKRTGTLISVTNRPCAYARSIAELERLGKSRGDVEFGCNYSLGERIFIDLYRALGEEKFQQGFHRLYLVSEVEDDADDYRGTSVGIRHVREAFLMEYEPGKAIVDRWYDSAESYDLSYRDTAPADPVLPAIRGRIDQSYVTIGENGPAVTVFSARDATDWVYLTLEYSYSLLGGSRDVHLDIVEHYEDGFDFRRRTYTLAAEPRYIGGTSRFSVGPSPSQRWAPGRYVVYVYADEDKVAQVEYEVMP